MKQYTTAEVLEAIAHERMDSIRRWKNSFLLQELKKYTGIDFELRADNLVMIGEHHCYADEILYEDCDRIYELKLVVLGYEYQKRYGLWGDRRKTQIKYWVETREDFERALRAEIRA